ncbi:MAG TPA: hypothetical protein PKD92_03005 [Novosphingobium sp.]|nr:hypothetical protein [Novosphingobium sp.]
MSQPPSRSAILLAGAAAILPATMLSATTPPEPAARFSPPDAPLRLTRTLRSPLADGKEIVSRRTYEVAIVPDGDGFRVDGTLVEVAVDAPPQLSPIAEIERRRPDTGLFPLRLDGQGLLVPARRPFDRAALNEAAGVANQVLNRELPGGAPPGVVDGFVAALETGAGESRWPADLFRPATGKRVERRRIALPDGGSGEVEVEVVASTGEQDYARMERKVTTALGPSKRVTREEWVLALAR